MGQAFHFFPFFIAWEGWAQLAFILGCLFVPVTLLGLSMVVWRRVRRRGFEEGINRPDAERAQMAQRMTDAQECPFGVRAMMQDPDVEGVWNSRASTPLHSPMLRPRNMSPLRHPFSKSRRSSSCSIPKVNVTDPKVAPLVAQPRVAQLDGTCSLEAAFSPVVIAIDTPDRSSTESSWESSAPTCIVSIERRPRSRSVTIKNTSQTNQSLPSRPGTTDSMSSQLRDSPITASTTPERCRRSLVLDNSSLLEKHLNRTPTTKKALDRMEAHRKFHAAESGQLHPRSKSSSTRSSMHKPATLKDLSSEHENIRAVSWPIGPGEVLVNFNASQKAQTMTSPQVVPFRAFVEMHPPPKKTPPSAWTDKTQGLMDDKLRTSRQGPSKKRITISNNTSILGPQPSYTPTEVADMVDDLDERISMLGTQSRTVNAGFEVLPVGTFEAQKPMKSFGSFKPALRQSSHDTSRSRKLCKRSQSRDRRSSLESTYETIAL